MTCYSDIWNPRINVIKKGQSILEIELKYDSMIKDVTLKSDIALFTRSDAYKHLSGIISSPAKIKANQQSKPH